MIYKRGPSYLLAIALVIAACGQSEAVVSSEPQITVTTLASTSNADSAPNSESRPAAGSYRQRYLSHLAPLIVDCMNNLDWEATYEPRLGVLLAEVPLAREIEREKAMSFCVASSRNYRGIYAD